MRLQRKTLDQWLNPVLYWLIWISVMTSRLRILFGAYGRQRSQLANYRHGQERLPELFYSIGCCVGLCQRPY